MAENPVLEAWKTTVPCRYFASGSCREGDNCKYLHDEALLQILSEGDGLNTTAKRKDNVARSSVDDHNKCTGSSSGNNADNQDNSETRACTSTSQRDKGQLDTGTSSNSDSTESQNNTEPIICQYFQQGCCMFGSNCYNKHDPTEINISASSQSCSEDPPENNSSSTSVTVPLASDALSSDSSMSPLAPNGESLEDQRSPARPESESIETKTTLRVNAPEFIPSGFVRSIPSEASVVVDEVNDTKEASSGKTWAQVVNATAGNGVPSPYTSLCPYAEAGECPYAENCTYLHGETCEFCGNNCLHPTNEDQRKTHTDECIKQHEREMELAFAVARSKDKQCGVCFEVVVDKNPASEQRFGILPNCNHCFCLACIRKWRQAKQFENKIIRACPECRVTSDFVCPSMYWVDTKEEKDKLINAYKSALSNKQCKYFKQGRGKCPFGNKCFYLHAYPDGTKVDTGPPIRRQRQNADGETDVLQLFLWDFLDERDNRWLYSLEDIDLMAYFSGSDDSDASDIEMY
ncbi:probable E3 ubiquitin-protein ligase makorin-1 [Thrips palmi]|uniref:RING-type E3 ubiquitin transferase n=1 Tax=Thrips palmi TaxID=161013 RepID=A0A6P9A7M6_THRPL|nr:probable E3 ubiquitin-protein ligase makorin-1 [Thrips palmi]XP_034252341.1 probable E3 ubiquitin-protein ligase makorin-1 [Thrips palmi]XP_034252342.1 probable E3 ubiquitin-protein ligase makorin-1 [Thrips palmi]